MANFIEVTDEKDKKKLLNVNVVEYVIDGENGTTLYFIKDKARFAHIVVKEKYAEIKKAFGL